MRHSVFAQLVSNQQKEKIYFVFNLIEKVVAIGCTSSKKT
jgi:hypothetical protein